MKYCPFKKNIENKDRHGYLVTNSDHNIAKVEITFGKCDQRNCMAFRPGHMESACKLIERGIIKYD